MGRTTTPLDVCLVSPGLPHDGQTLAETSLGGSETAAIEVARALAARGHHVTVFSPCPVRSTGDAQSRGGRWDGVTYLPIDDATRYLSVTPHDVTVISRDLGMAGLITPSGVRVLWMHDLALKRMRAAFGGAAWNLDAVYTNSRFHADQVADIYAPFPAERIIASRNGLDLAAFAELSPERDPNKLVYGSRPERGLENALAIMAKLHAQGSPLHLYVAGYDNTTDSTRSLYEALWARCVQMPNVTLLGPQNKQQWREHLASARALIYPGVQSEFREIFCLVTAEAQACGTPVVTCGKGAIPETMGATRVKAEGEPEGWACAAGVVVGNEDTDLYAEPYRNEFAHRLLADLGDDLAWQRMSDAGRERARSLGWGGVAAEWEADWLARLEDRSSDMRRLDLHAARIGDREIIQNGSSA